MTSEASAIEGVALDIAAPGRTFDVLTWPHPEDGELVVKMIRAARFWQRVEKTDDHWLWHGPMSGQTNRPLFPFRGGKAGLGAGTMTPAAREAWALVHGLPENRNVYQLCNEPRCVRPEDGHHHLRYPTGNVRRRYSAKTPLIRDEAVRALYATGKLTQQDIADALGVTRQRIEQILHFNAIGAAK